MATYTRNNMVHAVMTVFIFIILLDSEREGMSHVLTCSAAFLSLPAIDTCINGWNRLRLFIFILYIHFAGYTPYLGRRTATSAQREPVSHWSQSSFDRSHVLIIFNGISPAPCHN